MAISKERMVKSYSLLSVCLHTYIIFRKSDLECKGNAFMRQLFMEFLKYAGTVLGTWDPTVGHQDGRHPPCDSCAIADMNIGRALHDECVRAMCAPSRVPMPAHWDT